MQSILQSCGSILLLGEANFSFSLSLKKSLPDMVVMVTTCFQTEDSVWAKDAYVRGNITALTESGAQVKFGVDATKLDQCVPLEGALFNAIIFNFPHVGGKGNIGRNRGLVKEFFSCCSSKLAPDGRVLVTLCNGQGGTPADQPRRKWADHWQLVSMATYGSFILTRVTPFNAADYEVYSCTGYRSQSKGFLTKSALTHMFERGSTIITPAVPRRIHLSTPLSAPLSAPLPHPEDRVCAPCPPDLVRIIDRDFLSLPRHPLHLLTKELKKLLNECLPDSVLLNPEDLPLVMRSGDVITTEKLPPSALYLLDADSAEMRTRDRCAKPGMCTSTNGNSPCLSEAHMECISGTDALLQDLVIGSQPGLKENEERTDKCCPLLTESQEVEPCRTDDHDVSTFQPKLGYRKDEGDRHGLANAYEMEEEANDCELVFQKLKLQAETSSEYVLRPNLVSLVRCVLSEQRRTPCVAIGRVFQRCGISPRQYPIMHQCLVVVPSSDEQEGSWETFVGKMKDAATELVGGEKDVAVQVQPNNKDENTCFTHRSSLLVAMEEADQSQPSTVAIGECGIFHSPDGDVHYCSWNMDSIAMIKYHVDDLRLFWSCDKRILTKFAAAESDKSDKIIPESDNISPKSPEKCFKSYSLYPPEYCYDISFWVGEHPFDEFLFCSVVRSVTFDLVRKVHFLDHYINKRASYTYRLIYQSCDSALSKTLALEMHLQVGRAIKKCLGLEPR